MIYFANRKAARNFKSGVLVDNGGSAPVGRRWGRKVF